MFVRKFAFVLTTGMVCLGVLVPQTGQAQAQTGLRPAQDVDNRLPVYANAAAQTQPPYTNAAQDARTQPVPDAAPVKPDPTTEPVDEPEEPADPYRALGIRAGTFVLFPSVEAGVEYSDNVAQSGSGKRGDHGYTVVPELRVESNWSRHRLNAEAKGAFVFYDRTPTENQEDVSIRADGRVDVLRGTNVEITASYLQSKESRSSSDQPSDGIERTEEKTYTGSLRVNQRFNRLTVSLRGGFEKAVFSDVDLSGGGVQTNADRDYTEYDATLRGGYELSPAVTVFSEVSYQPRRHKQAVDDDGFRRDSDGYEVLFGADMNIDALWVGQLALGYAWRSFDDQSFSTVGALVARAELTWRPTNLTSIQFSADTDIEETTTAGSSSALIYKAGARIEHAFRRNLTGYAAVDYTRRDFKGSSERNWIWEAQVGLEYFLNRHLSVIASYEIEDFNSNTSTGFVENKFKMALKVRR